ncbi:unnamed protein product [Heligmosomoides polygyrus]|uniref:Methyltranfer_dom domain-containing protein n=1 Tax=Heligmosomoides polygyrus TaxID=6339 RepID=A0A183FMX4_HELPZ|nr:unnamed protein product [Heligmosomoides polygyrus]
MDKPLKKAVLQCFVAFVFYLIGLYQNWSENKVVDVKAFDEEELNQTSNQSDWIRSYYEKKVPERMKFLRNMNSYTMSTFYTVVGPEVFCANLVRVGLVADGGKYICNIDRIPKGNCRLNYALFSLEPNPFCDDINPCCEYSFIHLDCVHKYGAAILKLYLKDLKPPLW